MTKPRHEAEEGPWICHPDSGALWRVTGCCSDYTCRCKPGLTQEPGLSWANRSYGLFGLRGLIRKGGRVLCSAKQAVLTVPRLCLGCAQVVPGRLCPGCAHCCPLRHSGSSRAGHSESKNSIRFCPLGGTPRVTPGVPDDTALGQAGPGSGSRDLMFSVLSSLSRAVNKYPTEKKL